LRLRRGLGAALPGRVDPRVLRVLAGRCGRRAADASMSGRSHLQALARGHGGAGVVAVPLALPSAARIQEREWEEFLTDPTQLANGLRDLHQAVSPDGLAVTDAVTLLEQASADLVSGAHAQAALEAVSRLRSSLGDSVALIAPVPGPGRVAATGAGDPEDAVQALGKELLGAGVDALLVLDDGDPGPGLGTLGNIARFHQAVVAVLAEPGA